MTKDDAREELRNAIESHADAVASTHNPNMEEQDTEATAEECDKAIDAFAAACVAEAVGPALALIEEWLADFKKAGYDSLRLPAAIDSLKKARDGK